MFKINELKNVIEMKKLIFILFVGLVVFGCGNSKNQQTATTEVPQEVVVLTVEELYQNAADLENKEVVVKGTVIHVCKETGERCFLMGSNEDINIRVEAGEKIGIFEQELMGSDLEISGVLKMVKGEADAHNPGQGHGKGEKEDADTEEVHKIIAESQEAAETIYFIEGMKVKEL